MFKATYADEPERFREASPTWRTHADAPPFLVLHGDSDTLVPVSDARTFVERLREATDSPVLYAELAGAEHAFDDRSDRSHRPSGRDDRALPRNGS